MTHWSRAYIGLPWREHGRARDGVDCWGLIRLVYAERLAIDLPAYADQACPIERAEIARLIDRGRGDWQRIPPAKAEEFDVAIFRRGSIEAHIGLVVAPGLFLHVCADADAHIEHFDRGGWGRKLAGIFRHQQIA